MIAMGNRKNLQRYLTKEKHRRRKANKKAKAARILNALKRRGKS